MSKIAAARAVAAARHETLLATVHEVQARLKPATLAEHAIEGIKRKSEAAARERPVAVGAAAAGLVALIAARPIARLARRIVGKDDGGARGSGDGAGGNRGGKARHEGEEQ